MKLRIALVACLTAYAAGTVSARGADAYVSGILHQSLGGATLGPIDGRRLPVHNLGSSGEDGVEIHCRSAWGGAVGVDLSQFAGVGNPNREIKIRPKGWDGTIKGNMRAYTAPATGEIMLAADFSDIGATEASYVMYDDTGHPVSAGIMPADGIAMPPCVNQYQIWYIQATLISYGPPKQWSFVWKWFCSSCPDPWGWWIPGGCGGISSQFTIVVTPNVPGGLPGVGELDALLVTGRDLPDLDGDGVPDLVVGNADLKSFPIPCPPWDCLGPDTGFNNARWGLGQAQISEECTPDSVGGCDESVRRLPVRNLGSSGQDGIAIALPPNNSGASLALAKGNCCRGHVIIMKLYDDEGQAQRIIRTQSNDPNDPFEELDADFSSLGATGFRLTLFGVGGGVVGPPGGTAIFNGGPRPYLTNRCPIGSNEIWENIGTTSNPVWHFVGCTPDFGWFDFVLPGVGLVPDVASFRVEPLDALLGAGSPVQLEITNDDDEGFDITAITVAPPVCRGDSNCDGNITWRDIDFFVAAMNDNVSAWGAKFLPGSPGCTFASNDCNTDGHVTWRDINPFVAAMNTTCP